MILQGLSHGLFRCAGFRWELRRSGELRVGLWRKRLVSSSTKKPVLRRLVIVPGFGDGALSWVTVTGLLLPWLKGWEKNLSSRPPRFDEIVLVDFPGFPGALAGDPTFSSVDSMIRVLKEVLDSLKPNVLVGHSLGGWLTAAYTARASAYSPEVLILINPAGGFADSESRENWRELWSEIGDAGFGRLRPKLFAKEPRWFKWLVPEVKKFLQKDEVRFFIHSFRPEHEVISFPSKIRAKTWVIWGDQDALTPPESLSGWAHVWNTDLASPHVIWLKGVGHSPQLEKPVALAKVIAGVLSANEPGGKGPAARTSQWEVLPLTALL